MAKKLKEPEEMELMYQVENVRHKFVLKLENVGNVLSKELPAHNKSTISKII